MSVTILPDWLYRRAMSDGNHVAIEHDETKLTYKDLFTRSSELAGLLLEIDIKEGERVAILAKNGLLFSIGMHALMQINAILVPLNTRLKSAEMIWQLRDAQVQLLLYDDQCIDLVQQIHREMEHIKLRNLNESPKNVQPAHRCFVNLDDVQVIMYTSGTTGHPKGVMLTYANHFWMAMSSALQLGLNKEDKWLAPTPLFHMSGLGVLMKSVIYGTTAVLHDSFDPVKINTSIDMDKITLLSVVPVMLQKMLKERNGKSYPDSLRCVLLGGSSTSQTLLEQAYSMGLPIAQSYGLTEACSQVTTLSPLDRSNKPGSYGKPLFTTEVAIIKDGKVVEPGVEGEIIVRGPTISPGYYNNPTATSETFKEGWLYTGDIGYLDKEGYLYTLDRRKDILISGGENVYPAEIERVILQHSSVEDVGIVGIEDEKWGRVPVAFVKTRASVTEQELIRFCREHLAGYKIPKRIIWIEELPRNASGKLMRNKLEEWACV